MRSFVIGFAASLAAAAPVCAGNLTVQRLFEAPDLQGPSLRQVKFSPDGTLVSYLRGRDDDPQAYDLWAYDIALGQHRMLVDSQRLVPAAEVLSPEEEARRERQRTAALRGIVDYQWAPDSRALLFPLGGDLYHYDLSAPVERAVKRLTSTESYETDPQYSPTRPLCQLHPRPGSLCRRGRDGQGAAADDGRRRIDQPRRRRIHRAGGDGSQHRVLVVAR